MSPTRTVRRRSSSPRELTNTLVVTSLPAECFDAPWLAAIRAVFAKHGEIHTWAPLRFLRRAIITFWAPEDAERAKLQLDGLVLPSNPPARIRVYRGSHVTIRTSPGGSPTDPANPDPYHLAPPRLEKNFLISPPGSPPIGWAPATEDPPNASPLAADLIAALTQLQLRQMQRTGSTEFVYAATELTGGVGITVSVQDFSEAAPTGAPDGMWLFGERSGRVSPEELVRAQPRTRFVPTALPPAIC